MNLALAAQAVTALSTSLKPAAPTQTYNKLLSVMETEKAFMIAFIVDRTSLI